VDENTRDIIVGMLERIAALEDRLSNLSDITTERGTIEGIIASLETMRSRLLDIDEKVSIYENVNIDSDTLQELLALKPVLAEIRNQQLEIERVLPALKKGS